MSTEVQDNLTIRKDALATYGILDTPREARFDSITRNLADSLKTPVAYISFLDSQRLWFKSSVGLPFLEIPVATSLTAKFLLEGTSKFGVPNLEEMPGFAPGKFATDQVGAKSILGRAITTPEGVIIGAVCVMDVVPRVFDEADSAAMEFATNAVLELLELRRVVQTPEEQIAGLDVAAISEQTAFEESLQDVVNDYMEETLQNFDWWAAQAWWYDEDGLNPGNWKTAAHTPQSLRAINNSKFGSGSVVKIKKAYLEPTLVAVDDLDWMANKQKLISLGARHAVILDIFGAAVPTLRLVFMIPSARFFDENIKKFFAVTTSLLPKVITRERVRGELQYRSMHDALTGLLNRRGLTQWIDDITAEKTSNRAVMFLDLDNFKAINDKYGHAIGDELLIHVANELSANTRPTDTVARIGGDEFVVVTSETDLELANKVLAKRVFDALAKPFTLSNGVSWAGAASIGVAAWQAGSDFTRALEFADGMMYNAKKAGGGIVFDTKDAAELDQSDISNSLENVITISAIAKSKEETPWAHLVEVDSKLTSPDLDKLALDINKALRDSGVAATHLVFVLPKSLWFEADAIPALVEKLKSTSKSIEFSVVLNGNGASADAKTIARDMRVKNIARTVLSGFGSGNKEFELLQGIQPIALILDTDLVNSVVQSPENGLSVRAVTAICEALTMKPIAPRGTTPEAFKIIHDLGCRKRIFNLDKGTTE